MTIEKIEKSVTDINKFLGFTKRIFESLELTLGPETIVSQEDKSNGIKEWQLNGKDRKYKIRETKRCSKTESDGENLEESTYNDYSIDLIKLNEPVTTLLTSKCSRSTYRDNYYGLWHPSNKDSTELYSKDPLSRAAFEKLKIIL